MHRRVLAVILLSSLPATVTYAQGVSEKQAQAVEDLRKELKTLQDDQTQRREQIESIRRRLDALQAGVGQAPVIPPERQNMLRGRGAAPPMQSAAAAQMPASSQMPDAATPAAGGEEEVKMDAGTAPSVSTVTQTQQGIFASRFSYEVGVSYNHFDQARVNLSGFLALDAIFLGRISIDETEGDVTTVDFTTRFRPTTRLQFDASFPFMSRTSVYRSGGAGSAANTQAEATRTTNGLADVSFGAMYRVFTETQTRPDVVFNARAKAPTGQSPYGAALIEIPNTQGNLKVPERLGTGTGTWAVSMGASVLKTIDPMVVFANVSYFYNIPRAFIDISESPGQQAGTVDIGNAIQYGAGVAFAVNDRASLTFSYTQRFASTTRLKVANGNYAPVIGSAANIAMLSIGSTFAFSPNASFIFNVGAGLTRDTPDVTLVARVPFTF